MGLLYLIFRQSHLFIAASKKRLLCVWCGGKVGVSDRIASGKTNGVPWMWWLFNGLVFLGKSMARKPMGFDHQNMMGFPVKKMFPSSNCSHPNKGSPHNIWVLYTSLWTWYIMVYHPTFDCILLSYIYIYSIYWYWLVVEPYPSEKWWSSSVGMVIPFPTVHGKSFNPFMETSHHQAVYHQYTNHRLHRLHRYLWWLMVILKSLQAYITIISP